MAVLLYLASSLLVDLVLWAALGRTPELGWGAMVRSLVVGSAVYWLMR